MSLHSGKAVAAGSVTPKATCCRRTRPAGPAGPALQCMMWLCSACRRPRAARATVGLQAANEAKRRQGKKCIPIKNVFMK